MLEWLDVSAPVYSSGASVCVCVSQAVCVCVCAVLCVCKFILCADSVSSLDGVVCGTFEQIERANKDRRTDKRTHSLMLAD